MKSKLEKIAIFIHWSAHLIGISTLILLTPMFWVPSTRVKLDFAFNNLLEILFWYLVIFAICYWLYSAIGGLIRFILTGKLLLFPWKKHRFEKPVIWTICISVIYMALLYAYGEF